jgi:phosphoribosylanthranilate isomerase
VTTETTEETSSQVDVSVCDIMKGNTSEIIKKMESQIPTYFQMHSDVYTEFLHTMDDLFGTCFIAEKEFFDKLNFDQHTLKLFDSYWKNITKMYSSQIDMSTNFLRAYSQMRISGIKLFDNYMHVMMESYAKMLSQYNSSLVNK